MFYPSHPGPVPTPWEEWECRAQPTRICTAMILRAGFATDGNFDNTKHWSVPISPHVWAPHLISNRCLSTYTLFTVHIPMLERYSYIHTTYCYISIKMAFIYMHVAASTIRSMPLSNATGNSIWFVYQGIIDISWQFNAFISDSFYWRSYGWLWLMCPCCYYCSLWKPSERRFMTRLLTEQFLQ